MGECWASAVGTDLYSLLLLNNDMVRIANPNQQRTSRGENEINLAGIWAV
jgi:hypothetical protein